MKINIEMEAWELATVIKGLTINAQPGEKDPSGTEKIKQKILSDKTREERLPHFRKKTESKESWSVSKDNLDAFGVLLRQRLKINEILDESKHREDNPNPNYRPPMGGSHQ